MEAWLVCNSCGYDNQSGHRFCGMCGTPLPHRPLSTPGAASTIGLTRVPWDRSMSSPSSTRIAETETAADSARSDSASRSTVVEAPAPEATNETIDADPATELVPPVSLEEYVKTFKYEPPGTPEELTMRAETPVLEPQAPFPPEYVEPDFQPSLEDSDAAPPVTAELAHPAAESLMEAPASVSTEPPETAGRLRKAQPSSTQAPELQGSPAMVTPPAPPDAEPSRATDPSQPRRGKPAITPSPVIEFPPPAKPVIPASAPIVPPAETRKERPRFLDIAQPPSTAEHPRGGSTITGPSFLGLSDAPVIEEDTNAEVAPEHTGGSHWRLWFTAAVVLVFAALGVMEWRSQTTQSNDGPVEVIRTKIRNMRHGGSDNSASAQPAPNSVDNATAKPEIKIEQPAPAQAPGTTPNGTGSAANSTAPAGNNSGAAASNTHQQPNSGAPVNQASTAQPVPPASSPDTTSSALATPNSPKPAPTPNQTTSVTKKAASSTSAAKSKSPQANDQEVVTKKIIPGSEEIARANDASDSAAEAAWLWKATAKGNPDAPIRLADMYIRGAGVPRSCEQAVVLLKTAATKENARARNRLASMYASGVCVQRNRVEAYRWVSSALNADPNSEWAQQNRDLLWQQMNPAERAAAERYR
jgi:hypothetical protein